jgi:hypothetical protein
MNNNNNNNNNNDNNRPSKGKGKVTDEQQRQQQQQDVVMRIDEEIALSLSEQFAHEAGLMELLSVSDIPTPPCSPRPITQEPTPNNSPVPSPVVNAIEYIIISDDEPEPEKVERAERAALDSVHGTSSNLRYFIVHS